MQKKNYFKQWVIADIHGCYMSFRTLVEDKIQLSKHDQLFLLGDYIDRGKGSRSVIDFIRKLKAEGYQIVTLRGNHEDVFLKCYYQEKLGKNLLNFKYLHLKNGWFKHGGNATLKSFGISDIVSMGQEYIDFFNGLEYYYEDTESVLVHAGLNFKKENPFEDLRAMLWAKNFKVKPAKIAYRQLIHGHTPTQLSQIQETIDTNAQRICLDNGCIYESKKELGNLIALELQSKELLVQKNIEDKVSISLHIWKEKPRILRFTPKISAK